MSMVARYYTSVACLDMQADNLMVLVTYGLSSAPSCLLSYIPCGLRLWYIKAGFAHFGLDKQRWEFVYM